MPILQITTEFAGQVGVAPRLVRILSSDNFATVTADGYLNGVNSEGYPIQPTDFFHINYDSGSSFGIFTPTITDGIISLSELVGEDNVVLPTTANHIATYTNTTGTTGQNAATAINQGNIQAGASGHAGYFASFPSASSKGSLKVAATANTGDTITTITNAAMAQASVISIPDPGTSTASFIISEGTQTINNADLSLPDGGLSTGIDGVLMESLDGNSTLQIYPSNTTNGSSISITNLDIGQDANYALPDVQGDGIFMITPVPVDLQGNANLYSFTITAGFAALAGAGTVTLYTATGSGASYILRDLKLSGGTNFSGGGGNRLGQVTDGTHVFSLIPAATMQSLVNAVWGSTPLPSPALPVTFATNFTTNLVFSYSGGTTDYTAGSLVISGLLERVA